MTPQVYNRLADIQHNIIEQVGSCQQWADGYKFEVIDYGTQGDLWTVSITGDVFHQGAFQECQERYQVELDKDGSITAIEFVAREYAVCQI